MITVKLDSDNWDRWPEVEAYADRHGITISEAIERLVNTGLSYDDD